MYPGRTSESVMVPSPGPAPVGGTDGAAALAPLCVESSLSLSPAARGPDSGMRPPQRPGDQVHSVPPAVTVAAAVAAESLAGLHWPRPLSRAGARAVLPSQGLSTGPSVASVPVRPPGDSETLQVARAMGRVSWIMSVFRVRVSVTAPATPARPTPGAPSRVGRPRTQAPCSASVSPVAHRAQGQCH